VLSMNIKTLHDHLTLRMFLQTLQQQYSDALSAGDLALMTEVSGALSIAYTSLGNHALAKKWADAFWDAWQVR